MKNALVKLINVKTIVTLLMLVVFSALALLGRINAQEFMTVFVMVITYYFNRKEKEEKSEG